MSMNPEEALGVDFPFEAATPDALDKIAPKKQAELNKIATDLFINAGTAPTDDEPEADQPLIIKE